MNFKRLAFLPVGALVLSSAMMFGACGDESSTSTVGDDEEIDYKITSSNSKGKSDKSDESSDSKEDGKSSSAEEPATDPSSLNTDKELAAPTDLVAKRLAPSVWELSFKYDGTSDGFIIQRLAPGDKSWDKLGDLDEGITHKLLDGEKYSGYYYRVAAKKDSTKSAYTQEVFVSEAVAYDERLTPTTPTVSANILQDSVLELVLTDKLPFNEMINSPYNLDDKGKKKGEVFFQARFVYGSEYSVDTVKFAVDQSSLSKKFKKLSDQCNSFGQVRVVWKDKNGVSDYSDWSIPKGTKAGTSEGLINTNERCTASEVASTDDAVSFSVPSDLSSQELADGTWMLEWQFATKAARAEDGFIVQMLDLENSKWVNIDTTGAGVTRVKLEGRLPAAYNYYRVAAFDKNGTSEFSKDIMITEIKEENGVVSKSGLVPPTDIKIVRVAPSVWELSWKYNSTKERGEDKFILQSSKLVESGWTTDTTMPSGARFFYIDGKDKIETYYRMALTDGQDTSLFTDAMQVTPDIAYRPDMEPKMPELSARIGVLYTMSYDTDRDSSTKNEKTLLGANVAYDVTNNYINHYIYESEYTDSVYYQARWFKSTEYTPRGDEYHHFSEESDADANGVTIDRDTSGATWVESFGYDEPSIGLSSNASSDTITYQGENMTYVKYCEKINGFDAAVHNAVTGVSEVEESEFKKALIVEQNVSECIKGYARNICGYRIQVRIAWRDVNKVTAYSEWTSPIYIGGSIDACSDK